MGLLGPHARESGLGEVPADALVDRVAEVVEAGNWTAVRRLYQQDDRLRASEARDR